MKDRAKRDRQRISDLEAEVRSLTKDNFALERACQKIYQLLYWPESPRDLYVLAEIQNLDGIGHMLWDRMCQTHEGAAPSIAEKPAALLRIAELESICAAMLQRWAVVHNLAQAAGPDNLRHSSVFGVASLSAEEFIADGGRAGGERLRRQEAAARVLLDVAQHLQAAPIEPGSQLQEQIQLAAEQLSSYPQLSPVLVCKDVDVPPGALRPGRFELVKEN